MKESEEKLLNLTKRKWWYLVLALLSSIYVFKYRINKMAAR